ncbi:MAG: Hsp20/alpha crystallin family protein [bacterium]|nr:Hsp20/alpha crystallin family protein [bacterium]
MNHKNDENIFAELAKSKETPISVFSEENKNFNETEGRLTVDVFQNEEEIIIQSAVAGVSVDDLEINITNESVSIRGERQRTDTVDEKNYFYQECFWGKFSRVIILPQEVDPEKSHAALKNGVLTIRLPKMERQKAKKIKVKID